MATTTPSYVFAGGGTGGHLYPALAVAHELRLRSPAARIAFVGARAGLEARLVPREGYPLLALRLAGLKGRGRAAQASALAAAAWGTLRCLLWLARQRPSLVVGVGGYASGPAVVAARVLRMRTMIIEQNHFPGATNRWLAPRVDAVCLPSEEARQRLDGRGWVTGNPVRAQFFDIGPPPGEARLSLLAFGGSRGAHSINLAMTQALPLLARHDPTPRIVHQTGERDADEVRRAYEAHRELSAEVTPYIDQMPRRLAEADLAICRAGATTLAELCAAGRPAILVPYPHAADDHQWHNAEAMGRAGAAIAVRDSEADGAVLESIIAELGADREALRAMGQAARRLARPAAAREIAAIAEQLAAGRPPQEANDVS